MNGHELIGILGSIVALTFFATAVSGKADTVQVLQASFKGFADLLGAATRPVTG